MILCVIIAQACGVLRAVEPLNSFLASLCKFTINIPNEAEKRRYTYWKAQSIMLSWPYFLLLPLHVIKTTILSNLWNAQNRIIPCPVLFHWMPSRVNVLFKYDRLSVWAICYNCYEWLYSLSSLITIIFLLYHIYLENLFKVV